MNRSWSSVFLRQILGHVVGDVFLRGDVHEAESVLSDAVAYPVEPHANRLAAPLLDGVVR